MKRSPSFQAHAGRKRVVIVLLPLLLSLLFGNSGASSRPLPLSGALPAVRRAGFVVENGLMAPPVGVPIGAPIGAPIGVPESQGDKMPATTLQSRTITFSYDRSGRLASANYGDGVLLVYNYDPAGNLEEVTDHFSTFVPFVTQ